MTTTQNSNMQVKTVNQKIPCLAVLKSTLIGHFALNKITPLQVNKSPTVQSLWGNRWMLELFHVPH